MATTTTPRLTTSLATTTDWSLANNRAQSRIVQLQEQRAREATGTSRLTSFFTGSLSSGSRPAFRVGQLDTELLDEELLELLKGQLWGGLKYFRVCVAASRCRCARIYRGLGTSG